MISEINFAYKPNIHECESASNGYLMSVVAIVAGLPLPIVNLIATFIFYIAHRKGTYFVRWHITQALLSQLSFLFVNSYGFWWSVSIIFTNERATNSWVAYIISVIVFNLIEFFATIYTAIQTRKGKHIKWWLYGDITDLIVKPNII